jgi:hypothetical protein
MGSDGVERIRLNRNSDQRRALVNKVVMEFHKMWGIS